MAKQFTPCPACGAVGEVGSTCQFCGTTVILKESATSSTERVPQVRTVTPQQYAEKISIYKNVEECKNSYNLMYVSIGNEEGLINLNGDLIYPLQHKYYIYVVSDTVLFLSTRGVSIFTYEEKEYYSFEGKYYDWTRKERDLYYVYKKTNNEVLTFKKFYENIHRSNNSYEYGALLNLKTMERYDNVCHHGWCNKYLVNGGYIDLEHFTIIQDNCETIPYEIILSTTDMEPKNTSNNITEEKLGNVLKNIRKKTTINQKLLAQIKNYMQEVKANPECGKYWYVKLYDVGEIEFYIQNNTIQVEGYILPNEHGVSLVASGYEDDKKFKNCKLFDLFEECQEEEYINCHYINFSFDAESLCVAIQHLAECYGCPSDKIKLEAEPFGSPNIKDTISDTGTDTEGLSSDGGPWNDPKQWIIAGILAIIGILYSILS